jgi:HAE1 family hydrophobic/amphiphilic exporter-1
MRLPKLAVNRPITIMMLFVGILLFGFVSRMMLPVDVLPDIELPMLTVITVYPGASANEVEQQITKELEETLAGVPDLKSIKSSSKENVSIISLEFNWNAKLDQAANDARDKIELKKQKLPDDARTPMITKINSAMMPVLMYAIEAEESFQGIENIIDNKISNRLKNIPGVASIISVATPEREIKIEVDPQMLQAYHLSVNQIATILRMENITIPGGNVEIGGYDLAVRIPGEFEKVDEINNIVITAFAGKLIRLRDVATVTDGYMEKDVIGRSDDKRAVVLMVQKQSGQNTMKVAKAVQAEMEAIRSLMPADVKITQVQDSSELVEHAINNLSSTIGWAALLVVLVVLFFLRELRSSLIILLTIPFSLIAAFIFMFIADFTVNIFSLMALAIAIGMVVDNAIVVFENITRHMEQGEKAKSAAEFGAGEMGMAISASTLTTIAVFLPMVFIGGMVGILFKQLALLTSVTLIASLFTALTLTPMLASRMLRKTRTRKHTKLFTLSEKLFVRTEDAYTSALRWAVHHRALVILLVIVIFVGTLYMGKFVGTDYLPEFDAGDVNAVIHVEVGTKVEETARIAREVEKIFREEMPEYRAQYSITGQTDEGLLSMMGFDEGKNIATIGAKLVVSDQRDYTSKEVANRIRERMEQIPELETFRITGGSILGAAMMGNKKPIEIKILGNNLTVLNDTANRIEAQLDAQPYLNNVTSTVDRGKLELHIKIDRDKAQMLGLNTGMIAMAVRQSIYGTEAGDFTEDGEEYEINVRYDTAHRSDIARLNDIALTTLTGQSVTLGSVAQIVRDRGPLSIRHEAQQRVVTITAELNNISLGAAEHQVREVIKDVEIPDTVILQYGGQLEAQSESFGSLYLLFALGLALVYMVMAAQFESLRDPFIIMFAVPLSIIGVIWAFLITGNTLSVITFIGLIMLIGIVVNNGIVLVDYTNLLRARGHKIIEATLMAGHSRMRPVLMTAFTTILGMVPLATSHGMGSEMWKPLGITVIGGLLVSTLITLIFIPVMYLIIHRKDLKKEA